MLDKNLQLAFHFILKMFIRVEVGTLFEPLVFSAPNFSNHVLMDLAFCARVQSC